MMVALRKQSTKAGSNCVFSTFFCVAAFVAVSSLISSFSMLHPSWEIQMSDQLFHFATPPTPPQSLGRNIVDRAFNRSYADFVAGCDLSRENATLINCIRRYDAISFSPSPTLGENWPWWFRTLLRDIARSPTGLFGGWHHLMFPNPQLQLCTYEKGGTKSWRRVHCDALEEAGFNLTGTSLTSCYSRQGEKNESAENAVFLRDPLERFLSAFLDKCTLPHRRTQSHCQPSILYQSNLTNYIDAFSNNPKRLLEVYVDTFPLKWDLHFLPMSLNCGGLFQTVKDYAFVGKMDKSFYKELARFTKQYPALEAGVHRVFKSDGKENETNVGVEEQAASLAKSYYTPHTVRRVLQYYAIDYITLNLTIPQWAEEILKNDE